MRVGMVNVFMIVISCFGLFSCGQRSLTATSPYPVGGVSEPENTQYSVEMQQLQELSLQELMSIPLNQELESFRIYQSPQNPIGENSIQFGLFVPITEFPVYSSEIVVAADMAVQFVNQHGGILGKKLVLLRADDKENTSVSASLAKQMVEKYNVQAFIGPSTSDSVVDVMLKVSIPYHIPLITQGASTMKLTEIAGDHEFWRMTTNNRQQLELITDFLHVKKGHEKILLVTGRDLYSEEIAQGIKQYYSSVDSAVVKHLSVSDLVYLDVMDLQEDIQAAQEQGITAIVTTLVNQQVKAFLSKIKNHWHGTFPTIVIGDTVTPKYLIDADLGEIINCIFSYDGTHGSFSSDITHEIEKIIDTKATGFHGAYIYDAVMIQAMGRVIADEFGFSIKEAIQKVAGDGYKFQYKDFKNLVSLFRQHGELSYYGYSGRVHFSNRGDNLSAKKSMYSIGELKKPAKCL